MEKPASQWQYCSIFISDYNLQFCANKDQCAARNAYYNGTSEYKMTVKSAWKEHRKHESEAMPSVVTNTHIYLNNIPNTCGIYILFQLLLICSVHGISNTKYQIL